MRNYRGSGLSYSPSVNSIGRRRFPKAGGRASCSSGFRWTTERPSVLDLVSEWIAPCPWTAMAGLSGSGYQAERPRRGNLYTAEERRRRDSTVWTTVQGVLAPIQFAVFLVSLALVLIYLATGEGYAAATASVVTKTFILYLIMVTGSIWEKAVFGRYLFAAAFLWEDVVSMLVLALHSAYLAAVLAGWGTAEGRMLLALAAYASYAVNATQFILKLRAARLEAPRTGSAQGGRGRAP